MQIILYKNHIKDLKKITKIISKRYLNDIGCKNKMKYF
jgi:hypothetical protein